MNKKTALALLFGVAVAGLLCLIAGLIVFFVFNNNFIAYVLGLLAIILGAFLFLTAAIIISVVFIVSAVNKRKNN